MRKLRLRPAHGRGNTESQTMPLPRIKKFCCATCKATGVACLNPAAYGQAVCRYHGARPPSSIQRGADHGRYKTGYYTQASKATHRATAARLMDLEEIGFRLGFMVGNRTPGRKPG
jgi:hypothetical protein